MNRLVNISVLTCFILAFSAKLSFGQSPVSFDKKVLSIYFDSNKDDISESSKKNIRESLMELSSMIIKEVYVAGHTDVDASTLYNMSLAANRAQNASKYLTQLGIKPDIIKEESFGEIQAKNDDKRLDRRVDITFIYLSENETIETISNGSLKYVVVQTLNANTREKIQCDYALERGDKNAFSKTSTTGVCLFNFNYVTQVPTTLMFSSSGYLNEKVEINPERGSVSGDTLKLNVLMRPVEVQQKFRFDNIFFYTDTDKFKPESKPELEKLVLQLKEMPNMYIEIQGHMSFAENRKANVFQQIYNHDLSHKRAKAVYNYLIENGIEKERLTYIGLSNFRMIFPVPKSENEADQNKRVEVWTLNLVKPEEAH
ncbi:MAG: OmpA family protein [Bacteroidia bacterium]